MFAVFSPSESREFITEKFQHNEKYDEINNLYLRRIKSRESLIEERMYNPAVAFGAADQIVGSYHAASSSSSPRFVDY